MRDSALDSYALLAFLHQERGYAIVRDLLARAAQAHRLLGIPALNWAEVRYRVEQRSGGNGWRLTRQKLLAFPLAIVAADQAPAELAGELKVSKKMSLADCFAAALAKRRKADLYTGDPEFRAVEKEVPIVWL